MKGLNTMWYMLLAEVTENTIFKHRLEKSTAITTVHWFQQDFWHLVKRLPVSSADHKYTMSAYLRLCLKHQRD
ncbi:hypothetical protein T06_14686 [Trichinella sp. T6]|nr:hypothetical protein T06_14686 [Trichinella sp. T6]